MERILLLSMSVQLVRCLSTDSVDMDIFRGCFWDSATYRFVSDLHFCDHDTSPANDICSNVCSRYRPYCQSNSAMTVGACRSICSAQNFRFYALQAGNQCFCGGDSAPYASGGMVPNSSGCDYPCTGDIAQSCGGEYRMDVYEITVPLKDSTCFHPGYIENVNITSPIDPIIPADIIFRFDDICSNGYLQQGPVSILCREGIGWNGSVPTCTRECPDLPLPEFAEILIGGPKEGTYLKGDLVQYGCISDGERRGRDVFYLSCTEDGRWIGTGIGRTCADPASSPTMSPMTSPPHLTIEEMTDTPRTSTLTTLPSSNIVISRTASSTGTSTSPKTSSRTAPSNSVPNLSTVILLDATTDLESNVAGESTAVPVLTKRPGAGVDVLKGLLPYLLAAGGLCLFVLVMSFAAGLTCGKPKKARPRSSLSVMSERVNETTVVSPPNGHTNGQISGNNGDAYSSSIVEAGPRESDYQETTDGAFDNPVFRDELSSFHGSLRRVSFATSSKGSLTYEDANMERPLPSPPPHQRMIYGSIDMEIPPPSPPPPPDTLPPPPPPLYPSPPTPPPPAPFGAPIDQKLPRISRQTEVSREPYTLPRPYHTLPRRPERHELDDFPPPPPSLLRSSSPPLPPAPPELMLNPVRRHSSFASQPSLTSTPRGGGYNSELYAAIKRKPRLRRMGAVPLPIKAGDFNTLNSSYLSIDGSVTSDYDERGSLRSEVGSISSGHNFKLQPVEMATRL